MSTKKSNEETAVAKAQRYDLGPAFDYGQDAGIGTEISNEERMIPFLKLLQNDSKQCSQKDDKFIEGAKPGMVVNTATGELFPDGLTVVPFHKVLHYLEWQAGTMGNPPVAEHAPHSEIVRDAIANAANKKVGPFFAANKNELRPTVSLYVMILDNATDQNVIGQAIIDLSKSKMGAWSAYATRIDGFTMMMKGKPPLFSQIIDVSVVEATNKKIGKSYLNFKFEPAIGGSVKDSFLPPVSPIYAMARDLNDMARTGKIKADEREGDDFGAATNEDADGEF